MVICVKNVRTKRSFEKYITKKIKRLPPPIFSVGPLEIITLRQQPKSFVTSFRISPKAGRFTHYRYLILEDEKDHRYLRLNLKLKKYPGYRSLAVNRSQSVVILHVTGDCFCVSGSYYFSYSPHIYLQLLWSRSQCVCYFIISSRVFTFSVSFSS